MANWFHRFFNPHCSHCTHERQEQLFCKSCEVLANEVSRLRSENERLLDRVLEKPTVEPRDTVAPAPTTELKPRNIPWRVRQQSLEAEDRERAKLMAKAPKSDESVAELEKELGVVAAKREAEGTNGA